MYSATFTFSVVLTVFFIAISTKSFVNGRNIREMRSSGCRTKYVLKGSQWTKIKCKDSISTLDNKHSNEVNYIQPESTSFTRIGVTRKQVKSNPHQWKQQQHQNSAHWMKIDSSEESTEEIYDEGLHSYVMTNHNEMSTESPKHQNEDDTLQEAFHKHMHPNLGEEIINPHDVYAYKLPSNLWFIIRYKRNPNGQWDKYMNIVSSFTNYLDKLDASTKSVSVNVKDVETVFRLTTKPHKQLR